MPSPFDTTKLACSLPWEDDWVTAVAFVGDSRRLVAGNRLGGILLWDLPASAAEIDAKAPPGPKLKLDGHSNGITHIATTPDGKLVVSASFDHTIALWDVTAAPQGKAMVVLDAETQRKKAKQGKKPEPTAGVEVGVIKPMRVLAEHKEWIQALALSRDGEILVTGDDAGEVIVWRLPDATIVKRWKTKGWVNALAISPDKKTLAVSERIPLDGDRFRALGLWDIEKGERLRDLMPAMPKKDMEFASADFSPDGATLAVGQGDDETENAKVFLLDPTAAGDGKKARESKATHQYGVRRVRFTPDGKYVFSSGRDTTIRVWNPADGTLVKEIGSPRGGQFKDWLCDFALSADQRLIAGADMAGMVQVWATG